LTSRTFNKLAIFNIVSMKVTKDAEYENCLVCSRPIQMLSYANGTGTVGHSVSSAEEAFLGFSYCRQCG
jgi:uncharacterized protein with PIN domain